MKKTGEDVGEVKDWQSTENRVRGSHPGPEAALGVLEAQQVLPSVPVRICCSATGSPRP